MTKSKATNTVEMSVPVLELVSMKYEIKTF